MTICAILEQQIDRRHSGDDCEFNGYLEDYLGSEPEISPVMKDALERIFAYDSDAKICVGLKSGINKDAISNQIIRYKDIFKLSGRVMTYPFIVYTASENEERALLIVPDCKGGHIFAKGYYYCMTEPGSIFIDCKNEIVAISSPLAGRIAETFEQLFKVKTGALQRAVDRDYFTTYDELKAKVLEAAEAQKEDVRASLAGLEDRAYLIAQYVVNWFLMKKVLYVQYMVNKNILNAVHEGNVKKQRNQAKTNADEVPFMSYSEMWRLGTGEEE